MRNVALEAPRLELSNFVKRSDKEMIGLRGVAQIEKSSPGDTKAGSEQLHKEK